MFDLSGMTALVTGASGGLGSAIAKALAGQGARLAVSGSNVEKLESFRGGLGGDHVALACNLSDGDAVDSRPPMDGCIPTSVELCDGIDSDCDGRIDEGFDVDGDGYTTCGTVETGGLDDGLVDCRDDASEIHPGAEETCNAIDDDCDGTVDDGVRVTCYQDVDNDGFAASSTSSPWWTCCSRSVREGRAIRGVRWVRQRSSPRCSRRAPRPAPRSRSPIRRPISESS